MSSNLTYSEIREAALQLKEEERGMLVQELQDSFEEPSPELLAELERRWEEIETGKVRTIPAEEAMESLRRSLEEHRAKRAVAH